MRDYSECRHYVDHILAEHQRLHRMLRQMRAAIVSSVQPGATPTFEEVARILGRLRDELQLHFTEEEAGGCLDEAVSRCPSLAAELKRIEAEHPMLLGEITRLIGQANHLEPTVQNKVAMQKAFDRLYLQLRAHEKAENQLLAQGFGTNLNSAESDQPALHLNLIFDVGTPAPPLTRRKRPDSRLAWRTDTTACLPRSTAAVRY